MNSVDETNPNYVKIMDYIGHNPAAVLGTIDKDGQPHGAVVYVIPASHGTVCFVTKNQTRKFANIANQPLVSLTIFNDKQSTTLQASGHAFVADDSQGLKQTVMDKMAEMHATMSDWLPPVTKIQNGEYAVIGIELTAARLADYSSIDVGGPVYTEL